jgi:hypothetical protein
MVVGTAALGRRPRSAPTSPRGRQGLYPITYEHCIPLVTIREGLKSASADLSTLTEFLNAHIAGVVVTKDEDMLLRAARLHRSMPAGAQPNDRLARYQAAGVDFEPEGLAKLLAWPRRPAE